ncbi:glycosyltransferase [Marinilabiliaceae bacterium JC017]|nr:glycosyltransferase [Marinilabiliaceae bacterium JC017]
MNRMTRANYRPTIKICATSDFTTDYRIFKTGHSLNEAGFQISYVGRKRHDFHKNLPKPFPIHLLNTWKEKGPLFYVLFNLRLFLFLLYYPADIIFSVDSDTLPACLLAGKLRKRPVVFDSHEYFPEVPELHDRPFIKNIWKTLDRLFIKRIDAGITVCQSIARIYKEKYNIPFEVVRNLPLANRSNQTAMRKNNKVFTLIYQGALNVGRGLEQSIRAMQLIDNAQLIIIGDGDITDQLKQLVIDLKLQEKVLFTGKLPFEQLPAYTQSADLGLSLLENRGLNYYYALPNRIFDFIQAGLPILAIDFPEISRVVKKYNVGNCISSMDPTEIATAVNAIRHNPEQLNLWQRNTRQAASQLTWENESRLLTTLVNDLSPS